MNYRTNCTDSAWKGSKRWVIKPFIKKASSSLLLISALSLSLIASASAATWVQPYTSGSTADDILNFNNGISNSATAPLSDYGKGLKYSTTAATVTGGGWALMASGAVGFGQSSNPNGQFSGESQAQTRVNAQALYFNIVTSGVSNLTGAIVPMTWSASSTIIESNTWTDQGTQYAYKFDSALNSTLVSNNSNIFGAITLTIKAGSSILYQQTGLAQILGVGSITQSSYSGTMVEFTYDQASGPLEITWSANSSVTAATLALLGNGTGTFFKVNNASIMVDPIPEPSTYALIVGAAGTLLLCRQRKTIRATA